MATETKILGVNAYHGDSSAALLVNGDLVMAVEEERFNRIKHWAGLPVLAAKACLARAQGSRADHVAISRDPRAHFWKKVLRVAARPSYWFHAAGRAVNSAKIANSRSR